MPINQDNLIQTLIERSIEEAIRVNLVSSGYLPDYTLYVGNRPGYDVALKNIAQANGFAIEVFGHSDSQSKGIKKIPRIVIVPGRTIPGDIGFEFGPVYEPNGETYTKKTQAIIAGDFQFDVHLAVNSAKQHRILHHIWNTSVGPLRFIPLYNEPNQRFLVEMIGYYDNPDVVDGITEAIYTCQAKDLYLDGGITVGTISKIKQITLEITPYGNATLLPDGTVSDDVPTDIGTIKVDPMQLYEDFYKHSGEPIGEVTIPGISAALFVSIERGSVPIHQSKETSIPLPGFYRVNVDNTITIRPYLLPGEILTYVLQK